MPIMGPLVIISILSIIFCEIGLTWGNNLFVAVAASGTGNRVMTSPDGITWTSRTSAADNAWRSVTWGNYLFVAVANTGGGNNVMTSPDGTTWTIRTSPSSTWNIVTYGYGLFVAVSSMSTRVMTSPNGITWTGILESMKIDAIKCAQTLIYSPALPPSRWASVWLCNWSSVKVRVVCSSFK